MGILILLAGLVLLVWGGKDSHNIFDEKDVNNDHIPEEWLREAAEKKRKSKDKIFIGAILFCIGFALCYS